MMSRILKFNDPAEWGEFQSLVAIVIDREVKDPDKNMEYLDTNEWAGGYPYLDENWEPHGFEYDFDKVPKEQEHFYQVGLDMINEYNGTNYKIPPRD